MADDAVAVRDLLTRARSTFAAARIHRLELRTPRIGLNASAGGTTLEYDFADPVLKFARGFRVTLRRDDPTPVVVVEFALADDAGRERVIEVVAEAAEEQGLRNLNFMGDGFWRGFMGMLPLATKSFDPIGRRCELATTESGSQFAMPATSSGRGRFTVGIEHGLISAIEHCTSFGNATSAHSYVYHYAA